LRYPDNLYPFHSLSKMPNLIILAIYTHPLFTLSIPYALHLTRWAPYFNCSSVPWQIPYPMYFAFPNILLVTPCLNYTWSMYSTSPVFPAPYFVSVAGTLVTVLCMWNCTAHRNLFVYICWMWQKHELSLWHYDADAACYKYKQINFHSVRSTVKGSPCSLPIGLMWMNFDNLCT